MGLFTKGSAKAAPAHLRIIVVGCGKVGRALLERLSKEGHDLVLIDQRNDVLEEMSNLYDIMTVKGNGASYQVQKEAGIDGADLIIAVTKSDELNLLCCVVASQINRCAAIARVRTPDYNRELGYLRDRLGLAMIINPELEAAREIARILYLPSALEVNTFAHGQALMTQFKVPENPSIDGVAVSEIGARISGAILICAVQRNEELFIPDGSFLLKAGDIISIISTHKAARRVLAGFGSSARQVHSVMIIGGSSSSYYLALQLSRAGISVKIIEQDLNRCEQLSAELPGVTVIHGSGSDREVLEEEGIADVDGFVPLTGIDEQNIMLTLYAKQASKAKVVTKINHIAFNDVIHGLDLGSIIYPQYITTEAIAAYVRARTASKGSNVETLYYLFDNQAEAIEFKVKEECSFLNVPLRDLTLKKSLLIACIVRMGKVLIPQGTDCIMRDDTVIVITTSTGFHDIEDILR